MPDTLRLAVLGDPHIPYPVTPETEADWARIIEDINILAWFSGHNHLGQGYRDAISVGMGMHFVHCDAARQTRDGNRQSRIMDIHSDRVYILTLDRNTRTG